jgi:hypothetical protein
MDNKRNVFLSATIIYNLLLLLIPISTGIKYSTEAGVGSFILTFLVNILLSFLFKLIYIMIKDEGDMDTFCLFTIGFLTFGGRKRIYYSELGYFYMRKYKDKLVISKQSYFYSKKLFSINISDDLESIKKQIKLELELIYKAELEEKRKSDIIKNWDGYIDLVSKRDDTINRIIK